MRGRVLIAPRRAKSTKPDPVVVEPVAQHRVNVGPRAPPKSNNTIHSGGVVNQRAAGAGRIHIRPQAPRSKSNMHSMPRKPLQPPKTNETLKAEEIKARVAKNPKVRRPDNNTFDPKRSGFFAVYLCPRDTWDTKLDRNRFASYEAIRKLIRQRGGQMHVTGPGWPGWDDGATAHTNMENLFNRVPSIDLVLEHEGHRIKDLQGLTNIHTTIACNELYDDKCTGRARSCGPSYLILHHTNEREQMQPIPCAHVPHAADPQLFCLADSDAPKKYDFALVGRCGPVYPLRMKLRDALDILASAGYRCKVHRHPGYVLEDPESAVNEYVHTIQQTKIVVTCSSKYRYRLSKYAEIPLCGAALAADLPLDGADFFKQFMIVLNPDDTPEQLANTLERALPQWKERARRGRELTFRTTLQEHYAHRFLRCYDKCAGRLRPTATGAELMDMEVLNLTDPLVIHGNHCWWIPKLGIKVPQQVDQMLAKKVFVSPDAPSLLSSLAVEYTIMKRLAHIRAAPPVGRIVRFRSGIRPNGRAFDGPIFGYEVADATTLPPGPVINESKAAEILASLPVSYTESCLNDLIAERNIVNGYFIDMRRSPQDMIKWTDPNTLWRIPGVNMPKRRILLVADVPGWAWHFKALAIRKWYRGPGSIDIVYSTSGAPKYDDAMLTTTDHVHFFGWRNITSTARARAKQGLLTISTTLASVEHYLLNSTEDVETALKGVDVAAVSPWILERTQASGFGRRVVPCYNGVDTEVFTPGPEHDPKAPMRVLICCKPKAKAYDLHGLQIAERIVQLTRDDANIRIDLHIAKHNSTNVLDRDGMIHKYHDADVFVHTGRKHLATPNPAFEAAACGLPIVATANGCLPLLVQKTLGRLVSLPEVRPLDDTGEAKAKLDEQDRCVAEDIVKHLRWLAKHRDKRLEMGRAARQCAVNEWSWADRAQCYETLFETAETFPE